MLEKNKSFEEILIEEDIKNNVKSDISNKVISNKEYLYNTSNFYNASMNNEGKIF